MAKGVSILIIVCLFLLFIMGFRLYAETTTNAALAMEEHIEKVKLSNPEEYQAMLKKAGGTITDCCSCHIWLCESK